MAGGSDSPRDARAGGSAEPSVRSSPNQGPKTSESGADAQCAHGFCPRCFTNLEQAPPCPGCGFTFERRAGVIDHIGAGDREKRAAEVEDFYTKSPFPGYGEVNNGAALLDRSRRAPFLVSLDASIAPDAEVIDIGCGTAQLAAFLALSGPRRRVLGIDGCGASLACADEFRNRSGISNLQLVRSDIFDLPVAKGAFQTVISRGVVHHTPDPKRAIECVAQCVAPNGYLILGFYETRARLFHCMRRALSKLTGKPIRMLDPVLRRKDLDAEKKRIWIEDQYLHPLEHILPLTGVLKQLRALGFDWVRTLPPASFGGTLFDATPEPSAGALFSLRAGWALAGLTDPDAGLVLVVARKRPN